MRYRADSEWMDFPNVEICFVRLFKEDGKAYEDPYIGVITLVRDKSKDYAEAKNFLLYGNEDFNLKLMIGTAEAKRACLSHGIEYIRGFRLKGHTSIIKCRTKNDSRKRKQPD